MLYRRWGFCSPKFDLVPDFASLPKDILEKYKAGKIVLGDSKQVEGNIRAVLIDVETKQRVKDVTLKSLKELTKQLAFREIWLRRCNCVKYLKK